MTSTGNNNATSMRISASQHDIYSVLFSEDSKQIISGGVDGMLQRWRIDDGQTVGKPVRTGGTPIHAAALSPDGKRFVIGLQQSKSEHPGCLAVWDAQTHEKVLDVMGHTKSIFTVDISSDSRKFATGSADYQAFIWSLESGARLVGPLRHGGVVVAVRFSPLGERLATATAENPPGTARSIHIYSSEDGQQLLRIPDVRVGNYISSPVTWSSNGRELFATSYGETREVKCFNATSGALVRDWPVLGGGYTRSIALSHNQRFIAVVAYKSLSFWDTLTHEQLGITIELPGTVWFLAISPDDNYIATAGRTGIITLHVTPVSNLASSDLPIIYISDAVIKLWEQGDLAHVEGLFTEELVQSQPPSHASLNHAQVLAHRALVRCRLKRWGMAIDDAKKSIELQQSVIGYIAYAMAHAGDGDHESAMRMFDLVFIDKFSEKNFLLLIKAVILFLSGKCEDGHLRVDALINSMDENPLYPTVRAQMLLLLAGTSMQEGCNKYTMELLSLAGKTFPIRRNPHLIVISLISGWDFDGLDSSIRLHFHECIKTAEGLGDSAMHSKDLKEAISHYSLALSLHPSNPTSLFIKRSKAQRMLGSWDDCLKDADEAIKTDPTSPWGYETKHAALHALQRYDEAFEALSRMLSLFEQSPDPHTRRKHYLFRSEELHYDMHQKELGKTYVPLSRSETVITGIIRMVKCPLVLIDVESGRLCDEQDRIHIFKSDTQFKFLVSSMPEALDNGHIRKVVEEYFRYVTLSHVWHGQQEPSLHDVKLAESISRLGPSQQNDKLRRFCEVVHGDGYRWAWSDTCCIDKKDGAVLSKSLIKMYEWYEGSAATFAHLADVDSSSFIGSLKDSVWMTRAWTTQELLAPNVIRFYDRNWNPYLGDPRSNHKESPKILQELVDAIGIARETIVSFKPGGLTVREKLRLASTRAATVEEDVAYSLIGIFQSDIVPRYGEGDAALGHLLGEIVARLGEVTVLAWAGKPSSYNSCLPSTLAVYRQTPHTPPLIEGAEMDKRVATLRASMPKVEAIRIYALVTRLTQAVFTHRRLRLPCIIFTVEQLSHAVRNFGQPNHENHYHAQVTGIGTVEFKTSLLLTEPHRLVFVHPRIRDLCGPVDGFIWGSTAYNTEYQPESPPGTKFEANSSSSLPLMDDYTRALQLIVRLQQPFTVLLLQRQHDGKFKRIAAEHEIVVSGVEASTNLARDIHVMAVDIL